MNLECRIMNCNSCFIKGFVCFVLILLVNVKAVYAQSDTIHIKKKETTTLFSTIAGQAVKAKLSQQEIVDDPKLYVNDTIKVSSFWFTCYSNGIQHDREERGEYLYGVLQDISRLPVGGKAYFTQIVGYNIYNNNPYKIYSLEVEISK